MKQTSSIIVAFVLLVMTGGCKKFSDDINVSPNNPTSASNAQLLTYAINQLPAVIESTSGALYTQQWSEKPYTDNSRYLSVAFDFYPIYVNALENIQTILSSKTFNVNDGSAANQQAVSRILRAYFFW